MKDCGKNLYDLKQANRRRIFQMIREKSNVSRRDLAFELQLSLPTVNQNLSDLINDGYIKETGQIGKMVGRRATVYSVCENAKVAMGIDITKNHITVVCVNLKGECIYTKRIRYPFQRSDSYLKKLSQMVEKAAESLGLSENEIVGVGIAVPGLITLDGTKIFYGESLNFSNMTCKEFATYIPYRCELYNDADAAGYAEAQIGTAARDSFYISLNNSVGGAILINGQIYKGEKSKSGEIGHMTLDIHGKPCFCGQNGCLDVYCNATVLSEKTDGDLKEFFNQLEQEKEEFVKTWAEYLDYLAIGINNIRMLFDCKIIIGGYVGAYLEPYLEQLKQKVAEKNPFEKDVDYLKVCKVKGEASAVGAALPLLQNVIENI